MDESPVMTTEDEARWAALAARRKAEKQNSTCRRITEILSDEGPFPVVKSEEERQVWEERFRRADEKAARMLAMLEQKNNTR